MIHFNWLQHCSERLTHEGAACNLSVINPAVSNYCVWLLKCETPLRPLDNKLTTQLCIDQLPEVTDCRALKWEAQPFGCQTGLWLKQLSLWKDVISSRKQMCLISSRQNNNDDNTCAVAVINNPYLTKHFDCFVLFVLGLQFILFHVYGATVIF